MRSWTVNTNPSHVITISHCPNPSENVGAIYEMVEDEQLAINKVHEALHNREWGKAFGYRSKLSPNWIFCYTVHYPRFKSEKDGFVNHHCIKNVREVLSSDFIYIDTKDCYLMN